MALEFTPLQAHEQPGYLRRRAECPREASDYSFINLWGWADAYGLRWAWEQDLVWIRQNRPRTVHWAPVGDWERMDWGKRVPRALDAPVRFVRVPEKLVEIWRSDPGLRISVEDARGDWDYLYAAQELIHLKGNRFHKKKNLVKQFMKKYDFQFRYLTPDLIEKALAMQEDWCTWRDCEAHETLTAENRSIEKILKNWQGLEGVMGGALFVADRMVAYTVAEKISDSTLLIHFEKADPEYKGAYQAINRLFLEHAGDGIQRVNREQDLDDAGLRKAKMSYHPVDFVRKYNVTVSLS